MEQWEYKQDLSRFEFESEILTLHLLNWEDYKSLLYASANIFFVIPETYNRLLKKAENKIEGKDEDEDGDEDNNVKEDEDEDEDNYKARIGEKLTLFRTIKKHLIYDEPLIDSEQLINGEQMIDDEMFKWFLSPIFGYKPIKSSYTLYFMMQTRYISTYKQHLPHDIENYTDDYLSEDIIYNSKQTTYTAYLIQELNDKNIEPFGNFLKREKRHLYKMIDTFFGKGFADKYFNNKFDDYEINDFDFQFFSFLLNTYNDKNSQYLRKKFFNRIDSAYLTIIKGGIINLVREHSEFNNMDLSVFFTKWDLTKSIQDLYSSVADLSRNLKKYKMSVSKLQEFIQEINQLTEKIDEEKTKFK